MDYTQYLHLSKPDIATDKANVNNLNANMDTIDEAIHDIETSGSGDTVLQQNLGMSGSIPHATGYHLHHPILLSHTDAPNWQDHSELQDSSIVTAGLLGGDTNGTLYATDVEHAQDNGYFDQTHQYRSLAAIADAVATLSNNLNFTAAGLSIPYNVSISGNMLTSGSISATSNISTDGQLHVAQEGYFTDKIWLNDTPTTQIEGNPQFLGDTIFDGSVTFNDDVTLSELNVSGGISATNIEASSEVRAETGYFNSDVYIGGDLTLIGNVAFNNITAIDADFSGNVTFSGAINADMNFNSGYYPYVDGMSVVGVEANPSDTATDTLTSVNIGGTVYDISGGSGGSSVTPNPQGTPTDTLSTIEIDGTIFDIEGSGGGGGGTVGGLERTLLWDYVTDNTSVIPYGTYTETLHDDIDNYDFITAEIVSSSGDLSTSDWRATNLWTIDVNALNNTKEQNYLNYTSFGERSSRFYIKDTTFQKTTDNQQNTNGLVRVYGLKWTSGGSSGTNSEIIPIATGDGTNSRTFTLKRAPKKVTLQGYTSGDGGWYESGYFIWGETFMNLVGAQYTVATGGYAGQAAISYGADGKSFTITAANPFGAFNRADNFSGMMLVDYGGDSGSSEGSGGSEVFIDSFVEELNADNVATGLTYTPTFDCYCAFYQYSANRQITTTVRINGTVVDSYYYESFGAHTGGVYVRAGQTLTIPHQMHNIRVRVFTLQGASSTGSLDDLSGMVWNEIASTTSTSSAVAIPSGTRILVVAAVYSDKITIVGKESLANINKMLDVSQLSTYILGGRWADQTGASYGDNSAQISYGLVTAYSSYGTVTTKVYALS